MSKIRSRSVVWTFVFGLTSCGDSASSPPELGIYHLDIASEYAANVEIDPRGTFRWGAGGCDVSYGGDGGQWRVAGDGLALIPIGDTANFRWMMGGPEYGWIDSDVFDRLDVVAGPREGEIIISGIGERSGYVSDSWLAGGVCSTGCAPPTVPCESPSLGRQCYGDAQPAYCQPDP